MPYTKFHEAWENEPSTDTPITAAALDHIEEGIQDAHDAIDSFDPSITASEVPIVDAAGDFTATDVEGALAEIQTDVEALSATDATNLKKWQIVFGPLSSEPSATSFPTLDTRNSRAVLDFDAAAVELTYWVLSLPAAYAGGGINVKIRWAATTATSGDTVWGVALERIAAGDLDIDTDSATSAVTASGTADATSGKVIETTVALSHGAVMDSVAAGEMFRIQIRRDATNGSDTMAGDAELLQVVVTEQ